MSSAESFLYGNSADEIQRRRAIAQQRLQRLRHILCRSSGTDLACHLDPLQAFLSLDHAQRQMIVVLA